MAPTTAPHLVHWAERLEYVLDDGDALPIFMNWLKNDATMSEHPIYLHFSIVAYKNKCSSNDARTFELAENIFNKFLALKGGLCGFIPDAVRECIGGRIKQMHDLVPDPGVFDTCLPYVDAYLRRQHALFVRSEEFLEFVNTMSTSCYSDTGVFPGTIPSTSNQHTSRFAPSTSSLTQTIRKSRRSHQPDAPKLTAEALLKSQFDRENTLGESSVEKMFKQTTKYPYVCNATTSKNDSAVSSSFSSDANRSRDARSAHKLAVLREEQRRENPITTTLPRPERPEPGDKWDHFSEDGRKAFADILITKLNKICAQKKHSDAMNEQLKEIEKKKFSARDVIKANTSIGIAADVDDDDDVENYVKQRMADDSMKASPSGQSPSIPLALRSKRRSPKSTSPERLPYYPPQPAMPPLMTQSCMTPYGLNGFAPPPAAAAMNTRAFQSRNYPGYGFSPTPGAVAGFAKSPALFRYDQDCDTSGIGSMTTTLLSSNTPSIQEKHRAAIFQKARELSSSNAPPSTANRTIEATEKPNLFLPTTSNQKKRTHDFSSLPRLKSSSGRAAMNAELVTISYKDKDGVPVVAHVPRGNLTLKEFRKYLSISSKHKKQFFFKSKCDDDSAPYQLLLINDDSVVLPVFENKISAECKSLSDSE